jgi:hypothetical protein
VDVQVSQPHHIQSPPALLRSGSPFFFAFLILVPSPASFFLVRRGFRGGSGLPTSPGMGDRGSAQKETIGTEGHFPAPHPASGSRRSDRAHTCLML